MIDSLHALAADALAKRLKAIKKEMGGVRDALDIEYIHRMRVASRRFRAAFALFEPYLPPERIKAWRRNIRRITRALGAARDLDVQIDFVSRFLQQPEFSEPPSPYKLYKAGIERLLLRLRQQREEQQRRVIRAMDRLEESSVISEMEHCFQGVLAEAKLLQISPRSPQTLALARDAILDRLKTLLSYEPYVEDPKAIEELHEMRIAAKRLRYTLEIFAPLYEKRLEPPIKVVKEIQTLLGDLHDCDVWVDFLDGFMKEERERSVGYFGHARAFRRLKPGLQFLQLNRQQARQAIYQKFRHYWGQVNQQNLWNELLESLQVE